MAGAYEDLDPVKLITQACQIACTYNQYCTGPIAVHRLPHRSDQDDTDGGR